MLKPFLVALVYIGCISTTIYHLARAHHTIHSDYYEDLVEKKDNLEPLDDYFLLEASTFFPPSWLSVGAPLRQQASHQLNNEAVHGTQLIGIIGDLNSVLPSNGLGNVARIGGKLQILTAGVGLSSTGANLQAIGPLSPISFYYFSIAPLTSSAMSIPMGVSGHEVVFSDPQFLILPHAVYEAAEPLTKFQSPASNNVAMILLNIPANSALAGLVYSVQSYRLADYPSKLFCSDEIIFQIG